MEITLNNNFSYCVYWIDENEEVQQDCRDNQDVERMLDEISQNDYEDFDPVEKPEHYNYAGDSGVECIDYIKQVLGLQGFISYCRGNVIKYQHRAGYKGNTTEDMKKALWYQQRAISAQEELDGKG